MPTSILPLLFLIGALCLPTLLIAQPSQSERACKTLCNQFFDNELSPICRGALSVDPRPNTYKSCINGRQLGWEHACMSTCTSTAANNEKGGDVVAVVEEPDSFAACSPLAKKHRPNHPFAWCRRGFEQAFSETRDAIAEKALTLSNETSDEPSDPAAANSIDAIANAASTDVIEESSEEGITESAVEVSTAEESLVTDLNEKAPAQEKAMLESSELETNEDNDDGIVQEPQSMGPNDEPTETVGDEDKPIPYQGPPNSTKEDQAVHVSEDAPTEVAKTSANTVEDDEQELAETEKANSIAQTNKDTHDDDDDPPENIHSLVKEEPSNANATAPTALSGPKATGVVGRTASTGPIGNTRDKNNEAAEEAIPNSPINVAEASHVGLDSESAPIVSL